MGNILGIYYISLKVLCCGNSFSYSPNFSICFAHSRPSDFILQIFVFWNDGKQYVGIFLPFFLFETNYFPLLCPIEVNYNHA